MVTTIAQQGVKITELVVSMKMNSDLIVLFNLISLYRLYFVLPKLLASKKYATWGILCEVINEATDDLEDNIITDDDYKILLTK